MMHGVVLLFAALVANLAAAGAGICKAFGGLLEGAGAQAPRADS